MAVEGAFHGLNADHGQQAFEIIALIQLDQAQLAQHVQGGQVAAQVAGEVGDLAVFLNKSGYEIEFNKEKYIILPHSAILLMVRDESLFE